MTTRELDELENRAKQVVLSLADGEFDEVADEFSAEFESTFVQFLPPTFESMMQFEPGPILGEHWRGITALYGDFDGVSGCETVAHGEVVTVTLTLEFRERTQSLKLSYNPAGEITGLDFPSEYQSPDYVDEDEFTERELEIGADGTSLGATLSLPVAADQVPGIVLVHGAGGHGRDYTMGPNKIFSDLGQGLASNGYAVLRYDKRSFVEDVPLEENDIETVVVDDAVTALERLADVPTVAEDQLFLVGHSLGGGCTPEIARRFGNVAGIANLDGVLSESFATEYEETVKERWAMKDGTSDYAREQIAAVGDSLDRVRRGEFERDDILVGFPGAFWESLRAYNDRRIEQLSELSTPLFAVRTGRVAPELSAESIEGTRDLVPAEYLHLEHYEQLNHYFQDGTLPGSYLEPVLFRKPVAEQVVRDLSDWIDDCSGSE